MIPIYFCPVSASLGMVGIIWSPPSTIERIILHSKKRNIELMVRRFYPGVQCNGSRTMTMLGKSIDRYFAGENVVFTLENLNMTRLSAFQQQVLVTEYSVPRGRVIAYKQLAQKIRKPKAARAVGRALAENPFPIIIPCHRTIRADGSVGGFQGGTLLKRRLLELEGVVFSQKGTVAPECFV